MSNFYNSPLLHTLPPQKVSENRKSNKQWQEQCVDAIVYKGGIKNQNGRTTAEEKQIKYNLVNSILDERDLKYVLDPYNLGDSKGQTPARLRDINQIFNKIQLLKGEEMNRPFNFFASAVGGEAIIEKEKKKKELLLQAANMQLAKELGLPTEPQIDPQTGEEIPMQSFEAIEKYATYSMQDLREKWANDALKYLKHEQNLELKFNEGWEHGLIAAEEIYYIGIVNNNPVVRVCNPLNCEFDRNPDDPRIENGDWFREERWMTKGQIIDEFGESLTEDMIKRLDMGEIGSNTHGFQMFPGFAYDQDTINAHHTYNHSDRFSGEHILVTHVVWRSMKKIGFLEVPSEDGGESEILKVPDSFKMTQEMKDMGYTIEWRWMSDLWHGTKIGDDMYLDVEPVPNQIRKMEDPYFTPMPYVGRIYNSTNTQQTSFVDLIKPHQYLYNIVWYRLENELAKASGKKMIMDIAQMPKSHGWDWDKWIYMFENVGIAVINSMEEGIDRQTGKTPSFNGFSSIDMTLSQSISQYISILTKIEQTIDKIVGITPQREGQIHQSETVGGVERAVSASSHITEPWYYIHNEIKKKVLVQLLETAKLAWPNNKKINLIVDDVNRINSVIDIEKFADSEYGVFVTNSSKEHQIFSKLESLAQQALSSGTASFSDIISMFKANSIAELSNIIEQSELKKQQNDQRQLEMQQQLEQERLQVEQAEKEADRQFEAEQNQLDRDARLQEAMIKTTGFDTDTADNDSLDVIEQGNLMLKEREIENKRMTEFSKKELEESKMQRQSIENEKDRELKRKEIESKEKIEKMKSRTALKNKVSGEK